MKVILLLLLSIPAVALFAQFPTDEGIEPDDPSILDWGTPPLLFRGPQQIDSTQLGLASVGTSADAAGIADFLVLSLGEGGSAIYEFDPPIGDGPGWDLAVFENGFPSGSGFFLELGFVEVSSDGQQFIRFPATSLTDTTTQINTFDLLNPAKLNMLAGKYEGGLGTPFDLAVLADSAGLDLQHITHIRIVDVVGQLEGGDRDHSGSPINDPWPTPFASSGFDLDALAFRYLGTTSADQPVNRLTDVSVGPNPVQTGQTLYISGSGFEPDNILHFRWFDLFGKLVQKGEIQANTSLPVPRKAGAYQLVLEVKGQLAVSQIIVN